MLLSMPDAVVRDSTAPLIVSEKKIVTRINGVLDVCHDVDIEHVTNPHHCAATRHEKAVGVGPHQKTIQLLLLRH